MDNAARTFLQFKEGIYRHYKGGYYIAFAVTLHKATLEPMVHYYSREKKTRRTRTWDNFFSKVKTLSGNFVPRFEYVGPARFGELIIAVGLKRRVPR